jgi:uncharacterized protein YdiU (UPF0061 family)
LFDASQDTKQACLNDMRLNNPLFIPRNHRVEEVIEAALDGDEAPFFRLLHVLKDPYTEKSEAQDLALPPDDRQWSYQTFCGT